MQIRRESAEDEPKIGDEFQLLLRLPFDFSSHLPIRLLPNMFLDLTPQEVLLSAPRELVGFVLPDSDLPGMGMVNCCLRFASNETSQSSMRTTSPPFFQSITALRLRKPLPVTVAGQFRLGKDDDLIENPRPFDLTSAWQPGPLDRCDSDDITAASEIVDRLLETQQRKSMRGPNLASAVVYFSQVTVGLVQSMQLASIGLWASLEALLRPDNDLGKTLARRVSTFLSGFDFSVDLEEWIKSEYNRRRSAYAHEQHVVQPWKPDAEPAPEAFGKLHEITRLCLLGFLSMDKQELLRLQNGKKGDLKRLLNGLPPASGRFLDGQRAWLG